MMGKKLSWFRLWAREYAFWQVLSNQRFLQYLDRGLVGNLGIWILEIEFIASW